MPVRPRCVRSLGQGEPRTHCASVCFSKQPYQTSEPPMNGARDVPARSRSVPAGRTGRVGTSRLHSGLLRAGTSRAPFIGVMPLESGVPILQTLAVTWLHRKSSVATDDQFVFITGSRGSLTYVVKPTGDGNSHAWSLAHESSLEKVPLIRCPRMRRL